MEPTVIAPVPDDSLEKEIATVISHQKKLLRLKNWLCSPLLRLPEETIIHIISFIVDHDEYSIVWKPVYSSCHRVYTIMRTATGLWWKINCRWAREADLAFSRSRGSPRVIIAELSPWNRDAREVLDRWRDKRALHGHRLRRLELFGYPSDIARFQWIFEEPLPRLNHLKIHFSPRPLLSSSESLQIPITLPLPADMPLLTLDLRNTKLPWSSNLFCGLTELRLDFRDCDHVEISEEELLKILGASPQLTSLSLMQVGPRATVGPDTRRPSPEKILRFPRLASVELDNSPAIVGYIMANIEIPAINSLQIRSPISSWDLARSLDLLVPNHRLQKRLFSHPPIFEIETTDDGLSDLMILNIGSFKICFDFDFDDVVAMRDAIMARIQPLVPRSVTTLKIDFSESELEGLEWKEFLSSHPELRLIECSKSSSDPEAESLWDALLPSAAAKPVIVCPKLETISIAGYPSTRLLNCLLNRKDAGFELKYLKVEKSLNRQKLTEDYGHLVGSLEVDKPDNELAREVRSWLWNKAMDVY